MSVGPREAKFLLRIDRKGMYWKKIFVFIGLVMMVSLLNPVELAAQCAMCRASVESNISNGGIGLAEGLNRGILYLMLAPYALLVAIGYAWYRHSKVYTEKQRKLAESLKRAF